MENISTQISHTQCCGCSACLNKCPVNAISMQENDEGFLYPVVDESKCTHCGLCLKACPLLAKQNNNKQEPDCYAVMAPDEIRAKSSSGGMFTLLAEYVIYGGGYVCGTAFKEDWSVHHIMVNKLEDLDKLRGSKYVQSNTENCYKEIKSLLQQDKLVLFTGTPCQIAGLYSFLDKEYDNLITCDILCHGAPSNGVWQKYLHENFDINKIKNVNFRDKSQIGWSCSHCTITLDNNKKIVTNDYTKLFHNRTILRKSCENCKFSKLPRPADITLGDWWGIKDYAPEINDNKGLSLVLINTAKGEQLFNELNIPTERCKKIILHKNYNNGNIHYGTKLNDNREKFFKNNQTLTFQKAAKVSENKFDVCLISTYYGLNYGSVLVSFACNKIIRNLGYSVLMLNKPSFQWNYMEEGDTIPNLFAEKHYNISRIYQSDEDLINLNNVCTAFIAGSDQIFHPRLYAHFAFLDFVQNQKNKIAFATSFGHNEFIETPEITLKRKLSLHRFNHISLREKTPKLCNEIFDIDAVELIDPTLILPLSEFESLANSVTMDLPEKYLLTYVLDLNPEKVKAIKYIAEKLKLEIININNLDPRGRKKQDLTYLKDYTPEEFLHLYQNAAFVVTDSYHGTCFSAKFNKRFISFINKKRGEMRYKMFSTLGLDERIFADPNMIYDNDIIYKDFDFTKVNNIITEKAEFAVNWLKNALENNTNQYSDIENYTDLAIKELATKVHELKLKERELENCKLLFKKNRILRTYYRYKLLSKLTFGKKRKHYKKKYKEMKPTIKALRRLIKM